MVAIVESDGVEFDTPEAPSETPEALNVPEASYVAPSTKVYASKLHGLTIETIGRPLN